MIKEWMGNIPDFHSRRIGKYGGNALGLSIRLAGFPWNFHLLILTNLKKCEHPYFTG